MYDEREHKIQRQRNIDNRIMNFCCHRQRKNPYRFILNFKIKKGAEAKIFQWQAEISSLFQSFKEKLDFQAPGAH
jgi:hypothetical protein